MGLEEQAALLSKRNMLDSQLSAGVWDAEIAWIMMHTNKARDLLSTDTKWDAEIVWIMMHTNKTKDLLSTDTRWDAEIVWIMKHTKKPSFIKQK